MQGDVGTFTLTGQDAAVFANIKMAAAAGTFTLTGQDVTEAITEILDVGQFSLAGQDATLKLGIAPTGVILQLHLGEPTVFSAVVPDQNPLWTPVVPSQTPVWTEVA